MLIPTLALAVAPLCAATSPQETPTMGPPSLPNAETIGFLPRGITSFGAATQGGWLYVLGGYFGTPHQYSSAGQSGAFLRINLFDPRDMRLLGGVEPVQGAELVSIGSQLVRVGGMHATNAHGEPSVLQSSDEVASFDPVTESWLDLPSLPTALSSHRAVAIDSELHVLGGWTMTGKAKDARWNKKHYVLNLAEETPRWIVLEAPFEKRALGAAANGGGLLVVGGITPDRSITSNCWHFDAHSRAWTQAPDFPDWGFGVAAAALVDGNAGLFAAGKTGTIYRLDLTDHQWHAAAKLRHGRIFHELVPSQDGALLALGGIVGMEVQGRVRAMERVVPAPDTAGVPSPTIERITIPCPTTARNRHGLFVQGRSVYLFGGNKSLGQHNFEPEDFARDAWRFDFGNLKWTPLSPFPAPRQTMQAAVIGPASGIAVGGFGHNGEDAVTQASTWKYDFEFDDWSAGPPLQGTRSQFGLVQRGEELWVFGGLDYDPARPKGEAFDHRTDVLRWDGKGDSFRLAGVTLPRPRRAFAGALFGAHYFMIGGMGDGFAPVGTCDRFEFETGAWTTVPGPKQVRVGADLVVIGRHLYLVGGSSRDEEAESLQSNSSVERFDPETNRWEVVVKDLGMEMKHARAFSLDGRLCVVTTHRQGVPKLEVLFVDVEGVDAIASL